MRNPFAFLKFRIYRRTFYTYCVIMLLLIGSVSGAMLFNAHAMGLAQFSSEADSNFSVLEMKRQNVLSRIDRLFFRIYASHSLETDFSGFFGATPEEYMRSRLNGSGPDTDVSLSGSFGYDVIAVQAAQSVATTASTRGAVMAVSARSEHPREAVQFLNALNTDPEIRDL